MKPVTCITNYRRSRRNEFLAQNGDRIDAFIRNYIRFHLNFDFQNIAEAYVRSKQDDNQMSWDYLDLREELRDSVASELSQIIFSELRKTNWFNEKFVDIEQITDRCVSLFILEDWAAIS